VRRALVCGGRTYSDREFLFDKLTELHRASPIVFVATGGAWGADQLAQDWAQENRISFKAWLPRWHVHGLAAGPMRNQAMLDEGRPDLVVVFPGGRGTDDILRRARQVAERRALSIVDCR
jgi:hypothetical protein